VLAFTDGRNIYPMESAQDHKPVFDGDKGPNTGGMGAYSPAPVITPALEAQIEREILVPVVHAMNTEECPYQGVLYAGVMITRNGPKVLEFNVRFGDPETQPTLIRLKSDLLDVLVAVTKGELDKVTLQWDRRPAVCVVMASGGYPASYEKGKKITGLKEAAKMKDVVVFHAGTAEKDRQVVTSGGRVLGVTALGSTIREAQERAYEAVRLIDFEGAHYRTDIGSKAIGR
jgi:phosphoribosylamine--glycine ligase